MRQSSQQVLYTYIRLQIAADEAASDSLVGRRVLLIGVGTIVLDISSKRPPEMADFALATSSRHVWSH
jgi:hypothetical protein